MQYKFLTNSIIKNKNTVEIDDISNIIDVNSNTNEALVYSIQNYDISRIKKLRKLINSIPKSWTGYMQVSNNITFEKVSLDLYGSTKYWDILLLLNERTPIFDLPFEYDVIADASASALNDYERKVYKGKVPDVISKGMSARERFTVKYSEIASNTNEENRIMKYLLKGKLFDFINKCYDEDLL